LCRAVSAGLRARRDGLERGVLLAQSGRFPACGGRFLGECREEISKLLQPLD
jgi:hypothetical protein